MIHHLQKFLSPQNFYRLSRFLTPVLASLCAILFLVGLYGGLILAPADYQQGDSFRIIYIHVPSAWMSLFVYVFMAAMAFIGMVWKVKIADAMVRASAPLGASFTFLALATGSLWGKPMWGAWWVWDARLTSELILLFLYLGYMSLQSAIDDRRNADQAGTILLLIGLVNIPIIHYSVEWWSTLHQGPTVSKFDKPSIHLSMLIPLLLMTGAFMLYFFFCMLVRARSELLDSEKNTNWVSELVNTERQNHV